MLNLQALLAPRGACAQSAVLFALAVVLSLGAPPLVLAQELSENNAADWGTFASDEAATSVSDDSARVRVGSASIKFVTESGFDTGVRYPGAGSADWDLTGKTHLVFWTYAINETPNGFQDSQPVVVLNTPTGCFTYTPNTQLVPLRSWRGYSVPLAGNDDWIRTQTGSCFTTGLIASEASDPEIPSPGTGWFYLVTGANGAGERSRGCASSGSPRPSTGTCC